MHDDNLSQICAAAFERQVDELFDREVRQVLARGDAIGLAPILETIFDATDKTSIAKAKGETCRARKPGEWHRNCAPRGAEKLPKSKTYSKKIGRDKPPQQLFLLTFGFSLLFRECYYNHPPPFPTYAAGVLAYDF